ISTSSSRRSVAIRSRDGCRSAVSNSTAILLCSTSSARICWFTERIATGTATSVVTITATTAVAAVTSTTRPVRVRKKSRIGGVADAAHGADQGRRVAELGPHLGDVDIDGPGAGRGRVAPDARQQLFPGEHPARPAQQVAEQIEL